MAIDLGTSSRFRGAQVVGDAKPRVTAMDGGIDDQGCLAALFS